MSEQVGLKYAIDSAVSKSAAEEMLPYAGTARYRVWKYIRDNPRVTDKQIRGALEMNPNTQRPRRIELEEAGLIRSDGEVPTGKKSKAHVWVVTDGSLYPADWSTVKKQALQSKRLAQRPSAEDFAITVAAVREAWELFQAAGKPFPPEAVKVMRWIAKQGK